MYQNECHMFVESDAAWIYKTRQNQLTKLNPIQFELLVERCHLHGNSTHPAEMEGNFANDWGFMGLNTTRDGNGTLGNTLPTQNSSETSPFIFPGTKWCGRGDIAKNDDDLGIYAFTDGCCREHDKCSDSIPAGEVRHGLLNQASFTSSHCDCDDTFLRCLRSDNTLSKLTSSKIAHIYFNILKPLCFAERHPIKSCRQQRLTGECIRPEYNYREGRQWQFFASQPYYVRAVRGLLNSINTIFGPTEATISDPTSHSGRRGEAMPAGFTF